MGGKRKTNNWGNQDFDREGDLSLLHVFFKDTTMIKWTQITIRIDDYNVDLDDDDVDLDDEWWWVWSKLEVNHPRYNMDNRRAQLYKLEFTIEVQHGRALLN